MTMPVQKSLAARRIFAWTAAAFLILTPGCVRRRMLIRSNPPGAMVYVDNQPIGITPCATSFTYYGTREVRLVKPGFETLTVNQPIPAPWYQIPPIDFVSENLVPSEIQDYRTLTYNLAPQMIVPTEELIRRGEELRANAHQGGVLPASAAAAVPAPTMSPPTIATPVYGAPDGMGLESAPPGVEQLAPGIIVPPSPGPGMLPPGGRVLEALPAPQ